MTIAMDWIEKNLYIPRGFQKNIFTTLLIILFMRILYGFVKNLLYKFIDDDKFYYKGKKTSSFVISIFTIILVGRVWFEGINSFMTFLGLFSAALAIVMKDLILNLAGWAYIVIKSPFKVGDRLEIDGIAGDVIDIKLFTTTIMEIRNWIYGDKYTGRIIHLPNFTVFQKPAINFNSETNYIWNELKIAISYESNWQRAK